MEQVNSKFNQYIGCIGVKTSMRSLPHRTRSEVAKESIIRLCEANKINRKSCKDLNGIKKRLDYINSMLDDEPNLLHSGTEVQLRVTSAHLNVIERDTQQIIIQHELPNVSFASSGDEDTVDFVAYVAKDAKFGRACFVLECEYETAKDVLETIARGFQSRTQQILSKTPGSIEDIIASTRTSLEKEPWYHGSYISREDSETRLKQDGDFLVRESMLDPGHFVMSVLHDGTKLHLSFDSLNQVRTKDMVFNNISHLVKYHHEQGLPLVSDKRRVYLINGVRRIKEHKDQ